MSNQAIDIWDEEIESALHEVDGVKKPAQPDCRTCRDRDMGECVSSNDCTNGDHYKPAPRVVLWRTE
jgi:hypothetical protein